MRPIDAQENDSISSMCSGGNIMGPMRARGKKNE